MNSHRLSHFRTLLFLLVVACVLFIPSSSTEITEPIIDGDYIYIDDEKAYLKGTYSTTHGQPIEHWAMTKTFTGDCDMAIGFDGKVAWPTKVLLDDPHYVYWNTNELKTFYHVSNFAPTTDTPDYGNWYNPLKYKFNHKIFIGYNNATNESIWQDVSGTVAYFDSQENDGTNYTITWHTEHSRLEQYRDISNRILSNPIEYEFDNKNLWFVTKNIPMTAGEIRKIIIEMDGKIELGEQSYKYDIIWWPSHQTIAEARIAGNLYILDPYWNISFSTRKPITITTNGTSTPTGSQVLLNISYESEMQADFNDTRFTNSSHVEIPYWIESKVDSSYALVWVNLSDAITDPGSDTIWMYYGNAGLSDGGDGDDTFSQYHGIASSSFLDSLIITPNNIVIEIMGKIPSTGNNNVWWGLGKVQADNPSDGLIMKMYDWGSNPNASCYSFAYDNGATTVRYTDHFLAENTYYRMTIKRFNTEAHYYFDNVEFMTAITTNLPDENIGLGMNANSGTGYQEWSFIRKYIDNEPTPSYGTAQHYINSLHYNSTSPYNITIESDGTLTSNRSIMAGDDINDTAQSTGTSHLIVTQFNNSESIVRNFTFTGDNLDWYQVENITGSYSLKNSTGTIQTVADGNFTTDIVAGDYWVESAGISIVLLSQTPSIIYTNSTGYMNISYGITHGATGLNNTSVSFIYRNYDWDLSDSNHSIRPPSNDLALVWDFNGRILRAANRNETVGRLNFEDNNDITGGDTYTWSGLDENHTRLTIVPVNSTYTLVYINGTVHDVMPQMWYLDRSDLQEASKTQLAIHKNQNVLVKFWNFEIYKGNTDFLGVGYTDTSLNSNPALWPSDANLVNYYYISSGYDPVTGGDPITSGYAVYMGSLNASEWVDHVYSPHSNSNYVRGFIDNNYLHSVINTTNISYVYYTSNTDTAKPYYINMTNVATSTNRTFANTNTLWAGGTYPLSAQSYTPNIWFAFMTLNMSFDHRLYVADNNDLWGSSSMSRTNITQALFPPTTPTIDHFHFPTANDIDYDMDGVYYGNFSIGCGVSSDPDGGDVTHNLTLHYANNLTFVTIINNTFTDKDITHNGVYFDANFSSISYYSQTENYTLRLIATDDESESVTVWLGVNFSLDGSPRIISYSPETPVSSSEGENQTFSITTNLPGNVTWYLDSVEVFNETGVNSSSYSNSTAAVGTYNVTVITTNVNGSNPMMWDWTVESMSKMPLSIFIMWSVIMCAGVVIGFMATGLNGITSSLLTATIAYMNSKNIINGNVVQYVAGESTTDTIEIGYRSIESLPMSYIYLFIAIVMVIVFILQVWNEIQYNLEPDMGGDFFDE